ncbi:hypothetical protein PO124_28355 [Bacillus licheniformis]|nr:hypothetical protein [Bacillus licheniformis]
MEGNAERISDNAVCGTEISFLQLKLDLAPLAQLAESRLAEETSAAVTQMDNWFPLWKGSSGIMSAIIRTASPIVKRHVR